MRKLITIAFAVLFSTLSWAAPLSLVSPSQAPELGAGEGYLLVYLDAGGSAPSIEFSRIARAGREPLRPGQRFRFVGPAQTLSLKGLSAGFYLLPLREGQYQITKVNAPFYDLPYRLDTDLASNWRFVIQEGKTNYIGDLVIAKERASRYVETNLFNRIALRKSSLEESLNPLLSHYPLAFHTGYRDDFFRSLAATEDQKESSQ